MTVIIITEECHGFLGVAKDMPSAIAFLYNEDWIDGTLETNGGVDVVNAFGRSWKDELSKMSISEFNDCFDCSFLLQEIEVYEVKAAE